MTQALSPCRGLFVGLVTLDLIYRAAAPPQANQKIVATEAIAIAGGPATNAAIAFSALSSQSSITTVVAALGTHPLAHLVRAELQQLDVQLVDLTPEQVDPPPLSSVVVSANSGERAVVSLNATRCAITGDRLPDALVQAADVILIDGHQLAVSEAAARQANIHHIPVVVDGGSWKSGFESVLARADIVICSANFYPPGCTTTAEVLDYLAALGVANIAISYGDGPILAKQGHRQFSVPVPHIQPVDTLGAGDILHGAFCHFILHQSFEAALQSAAQVASESCRYFGPRQWMTSIAGA